MAKTTTWGKQGNHREVKPLPTGKAANEPCSLSAMDPTRKCDLLMGEHGVVTINGQQIMVHEGDQIEGSGESLVLTSHGMRYGNA